MTVIIFLDFLGFCSNSPSTLLIDVMNLLFCVIGASVSLFNMFLKLVFIFYERWFFAFIIIMMIMITVIMTTKKVIPVTVLVSLLFFS